MATGVQITRIICATLVAIMLIATLNSKKGGK